MRAPAVPALRVFVVEYCCFRFVLLVCSERDDPSALMSKLAISQTGAASSGDRSARRPGSSKLLTAAGRAATSTTAAAAPVVVSAYMGVSGAAGGYSAYSGPSSPTSRATTDKRPTVLTSGSSGYASGFVLSSPAAAPGTPDSYESDVSQGDHLLAARDRAKRSPSKRLHV